VVAITRPGGLGDGVPFGPVAADTPLDATVEVAGEAREVELFDGNVSLGRAAAKPYEFKGVKLAPGVHALIAVATLTSGEKSTSRPATVIAATKR
jgi:hypothetical protein